MARVSLFAHFVQIRLHLSILRMTRGHSHHCFTFSDTLSDFLQFILPDSCIAMSKKTQVKYKKAPQAPRRFKSSYMFFSTEKHKSIRKDLAEQGEADKVSY